jgi:hypothetical protein
MFYWHFRWLWHYLWAGCIFSQNLAVERSDKLLKTLILSNPKQFMPVLPDSTSLFQGLFQEISETIPFSIRSRKELLKTFPSEAFSERNLPKDFQNIMLKTGRELFPISGSGFSWELQLR